MCVNGRRCWSTVRGPGPCRRLFRGLRRSVEYAVVVLGVPATARWSRPRSTGWSTSSTASTRSTSSSRRAARVEKSPMAADERLSDTEALMWSIERDPLLRATFLTVTFLDRPPDVARFRRRMAHTAARIPRLRQRIDGSQWVDDPDFDLDYHIRHIALPPPGTVRDPIGTVRSIGTQLLVVDASRSPLWQGRRSLGRRFDTLRVDLEAAKNAAHRLGGTLNDLYVTGVVRGVGAYHRSRGVPVEELRMSMPISTRTDKSSGGNAFTPLRVLVPTDVADPVEQFRAVQARIGTVKGERALSLAGSLTGVLTSLPSPLIARLARSQVETVDFACSNVRGAPFDLYVAGAHVDANHPMGPTAGTACNVTLLTYGGSMDIGINSDTAAVDDPEALRDCVADGLAETIVAGS